MNMDLIWLWVKPPMDCAVFICHRCICCNMRHVHWWPIWCCCYQIMWQNCDCQKVRALSHLKSAVESAVEFELLLHYLFYLVGWFHIALEGVHQTDVYDVGVGWLVGTVREMFPQAHCLMMSSSPFMALLMIMQQLHEHPYRCHQYENLSFLLLKLPLFWRATQTLL